MTERETQIVRDLVSRNRQLERDLRYMRQHRDKARTERDNAKNAARYLHGLLIAHQYRLRRVA